MYEIVSVWKIQKKNLRNVSPQDDKIFISVDVCSVFPSRSTNSTTFEIF